ncbi:MAG: prolyl oligopeptidase family serine peptidase [Caulobacter sp.]|nr:prolyl oligopeptidase family serine peptidase [Caulobacter sp.]
MKSIIRPICLAVAAATLFAGGMMAPAAARQAAGPPSADVPRPPTAEEFGREPALQGVSLSPDGKYIAAVVAVPGQENQIAVWQTANMSSPPARIGCGPRNTCMGVSFLKSDRLGVQVRQPYTAGTLKTHIFRFMITDLTGSQWRNAEGGTDQSVFANAAVLDTLPKDPQNVLITIFGRTSPNGSYIPDGSLYKLNIYNGTRSKIRVSSDKYFNEQWDLSREVRARQSLEFESGNAYFVQWIRESNGEWKEHFRWYPKDREEADIVGFSSDPNIAYVATNKGRDNVAIFEYDISARQLKEPIFETKFFDAGTVIESTSANDEGALLGFSYRAETTKIYWTDPQIDALVKGARKALGVKTVPVQWTDIATGEKARFNTPDGFDVNLSEISDDRKIAIVTKSGPSQPTEYYMLSEGKLTLLGRARPWIDSRALGDMRLVQYPARDGLIIPALLTTPKKELYGPGPYPTIVVPHGGPWARDNMNWDFSGWVQYFAARGYVVLQPQYRGSRGWGQKLWRAGDAEWGQKMQDDKDDGAKWLIAQGIAAPDRIAMHGYSYGGYAAMVAAVRPNGLYQCAVAGAGVASLEKFRTQALGNRIQREYQRPSLAGMSPVDHVKDVSIPVFLYHGDRDTNVEIQESERFYSGLRSAGKTVKFQPIPDMGHEANKWGPGDITAVLTAVENYLTTECGPGGL